MVSSQKSYFEFLRSILWSVSLWVVFLTLFLFAWSTAYAGNTASVPLNHQPVSVSWFISGGYGSNPNCTPSTNAQPFAVEDKWMKNGGVALFGSVALPPPSVVGTFTFTCKHISNAFDTATLIVGLGTAAPLVDAGADQSVFVNSPMSILDATASDPDGFPVSLLWINTVKPLGAPDPIIAGNTTLTPTITNLTTIGTYTFQLTATDMALMSTASTMNVGVSSLPNAPTITPQPFSGENGVAYPFTFSATDLDGDMIRYQIDWDNDGVIDQVVPAVGYVNSGTSQNASNPVNQWPVDGTYSFKARTEDVRGGVSGWTTANVTIADLSGVNADLIVQVPAQVMNANHSITFTGTLKNNGIGQTAPSQDIWGDVEIGWDDNNCGDGATIDDFYTAGGPWTELLSNATQPLSKTLTYAELLPHPGSHCYRLIADRDDLVTESNNSNNATSPWLSFTFAPVSADLSADTPVDYNTPSCLWWNTTNATGNCDISGGQTFNNVGLNRAQGSCLPTQNLTANTSYAITCDNLGIPLDTVTVNITTVNLTASPPTIEACEDTTLRWTLTQTIIDYIALGNPSPCTLTDNGIVDDSPNSVVEQVCARKTFVLNCGVYGSDSVTVDVVSKGFET